MWKVRDPLTIPLLDRSGRETGFFGHVEGVSDSVTGLDRTHPAWGRSPTANTRTKCTEATTFEKCQEHRSRRG